MPNRFASPAYAVLAIDLRMRALELFARATAIGAHARPALGVSALAAPSGAPVAAATFRPKPSSSCLNCTDEVVQNVADVLLAVAVFPQPLDEPQFMSTAAICATTVSRNL